MKHNILFVGLLLSVSILFSSCQSNGSDENADQTASNETTAQTTTTNSATASGEKILVEGPGGVEVGSLQKINNENVIFCGGNKFTSIKEEKSTRYILNDGNEIYNIKDRGSSITMTETVSGRVLWQVFPSETGITLKNDYIVGSVIIRFNDDNQTSRVVFKDQEITTVSYKDGVYTTGTPAGNVIVKGQPYSRAYSMIGTGIAVAPPHQMILLAELLDLEK